MDSDAKQQKCEEIVEFLTRSSHDMPHYNAKLSAYAKLHKKRARAEKARNLDRSNHDGKSDNSEAQNGATAKRRSTNGLSGDHPPGDDDRNRRRGEKVLRPSRSGSIQPGNPVDKCGCRKKRRRRSRRRRRRSCRRRRKRSCSRRRRRRSCSRRRKRRRRRSCKRRRRC